MRNTIITIVRCLLLIIILGTIGYVGYKVLPTLTEYRKESNAYEDIRKKTVRTADSSAEEEEFEIDPDTILVDWEQYKGMNVVAWFQMDDIGYPVMQSADNEYYEHRMPDGSESRSGSLFLHGTNAFDFSDRSSFIYGHNMADGSMFGKLRHTYKDPKYKDHTFDLYYPDGTRHTFMFMSVVETYAGSDLYETEFKTLSSFMDYQRKMKSLSIYGNTPEVDSNAKLVSLSTCDGYAGTNNRMIIQGKEISVKKVEYPASWWDLRLAKYEGRNLDTPEKN